MKKMISGAHLDIDIERSNMASKERREIIRMVRKSRKKWEREKRAVERDMVKLRFDLQRLYPNPDLMRALDRLMDDDVPWRGDPDRLREPLAELLLKCHACGVFAAETETIVKVLVG